MIVQEYFLGGTSPEGFCSKFIEQIKKDGFYTYILKGGPGTGKSTLMKKITEAFADHPVSLYYCSSDINSLDAVVIEDKKIIIVDGTAPHVFEALYPGASQEIINLGEFWDEKKICRHCDAIHYLMDENLKYHTRVRCYIKALSSLNDDIYSIGESALDVEKLDAYTARLCRKIIGKKSLGEKGKVEFRQLSAFTTENYITKSLSSDYSVYLLRDDFFAGSDKFLRTAADYLVNSGCDVVVSECNMHHTPVFEHVFSETAKTAFMTSNFFNKFMDLKAAKINFSRFYRKELISAKKQRLSFDRKASLELADEAAETLADALAIHDELEKKYIDSIDFKKLGGFSEKFIDKLLKK